jgi:hypothetical protein
VDGNGRGIPAGRRGKVEMCNKNNGRVGSIEKDSTSSSVTFMDKTRAWHPEEENADAAREYRTSARNETDGRNIMEFMFDGVHGHDATLAWSH